MTRCLLIVALCMSACSKDPGSTEVDPGRTCEQHSDCGDAAWCVAGICVDEPVNEAPPPEPTLTAALDVAPATLNFGNVALSEQRTLALVLENSGEAMLTLSRIVVVPASAPFRVEPMGYGPFWVRPTRSREIFVTYSPTTAGSHQARLLIDSGAPRAEVDLTGN